MRPHRLDWLSLVFGLLFVLIAIAALADALLLNVTDLRWIVPSLFVALGVALVISSIRRDQQDEDAGPEPAYVAAGHRDRSASEHAESEAEVVDDADAR